MSHEMIFPGSRLQIEREIINIGRRSEAEVIRIGMEPLPFNMEIHKNRGEETHSYIFKWPAIKSRAMIKSIVQDMDEQLKIAYYFCESDDETRTNIPVFLDTAEPEEGAEFDLKDIFPENFTLINVRTDKGVGFLWENTGGGTPTSAIGGEDFDVLTSDWAREVIKATTKDKFDDSIMHITEDFQGALKDQIRFSTYR